MAVTFDPALSTDKDKIRQRLGDTDEATAQLQDETIQAYLDSGMSELGAARQLCLDLAAKWAAVGDVTLDDQRQIASKIYAHYIELAGQLALQESKAAPGSSASPNLLVGGLTDPRTAIQDRPAIDYPSSSCRPF